MFLLFGRVFLLYCCVTGDSEVIAKISVAAGKHARFDSFISLCTDMISLYEVDQVALYEVDEKKSRVPAQILDAEGKHIIWQLAGRTEPETIRVFELVKERRKQYEPDKTVLHDHGKYMIEREGKTVLQYNAMTVFPPEGQDSLYKRSGFIHPLFSPSGIILTNMHPEDHLHHLGIWCAWTKTLFRGENIDFWNLKRGLGTVAHQVALTFFEGPVSSGISAMHEYLAWPGTENEALAMTEQFSIRVSTLGDNMSVVDLEFILTPVEPIVLQTYRYGGFGLRTTAEWNRLTSDFINSEGLDRDQADGERARWYQVGGDTSKGYSGILVMSHPANFNHPEPLRVWASDANQGKGDHFINYSPTRNIDWSLVPGNNYILRYRMVVFDGQLQKGHAESLWNDYANPPVITLETKNQ